MERDSVVGMEVCQEENGMLFHYPEYIFLFYQLFLWVTEGSDMN